jgi:hypothetical protein
VTSQPPTGFENYPDAATPLDTRTADPVPPVAVLPHQPAPPSAPRRLSRRGLIGLGVGIPAAGLVGALLARGHAASSASGEATAEATASEDGMLWVGEFSAGLPSGWRLSEEDGNLAVRGANQVRATDTYDDGSQSLPDLLTRLVEENRGNFTGELGRARDLSNESVNHAGLAANGKLNNSAARLQADLWTDINGSGLLTIRVLTVEEGSAIAAQAQAIVDELSAGF